MAKSFKIPISGNILKDPVTLENFQAFNYATACEDCTHFDFEDETCTIGYPTDPHLRRNQLKDIQTTGKIAFCRTQEID